MSTCNGCQCYKGMELRIQMAFQPIVDIRTGKPFAYEALVRGENGEGAGQVLSRVTEENRYTFDQTCRTTAIETASRLNIDSRLSINFSPNAIYDPEACLERTMKAAKKFGMPHKNIIFEITEHEAIPDRSLLSEIVRVYRDNGLLTALDDFGEGHSGLNLLAEFQPDIIKLDMNLIRDIDTTKVKQIIVGSMVNAAEELGIQVVAEGIETKDEATALSDAGINLMQGYYFQRPALDSLGELTHRNL